MRTHYGPWQPCWISNQHQKHKSGRGPSSEHFWQVWLISVKQFQRRRFKCEKLTDGRRTLTHDKSSHGLWPGELKMTDYILELFRQFLFPWFLFSWIYCPHEGSENKTLANIYHLNSIWLWQSSLNFDLQEKLNFKEDHPKNNSAQICSILTCDFVEED
jgi:hypothetical protein